jgi:hypothetical protein
MGNWADEVLVAWREGTLKAEAQSKLDWWHGVETPKGLGE